MRSPLRVGVVVFGVLALLGCSSEGVREDRTIQSTSQSETLAFQHGRKGVFVWDAGKLRKIFAPDSSVLATSAPLFSPVDGRTIFCTAERAEMEPRADDDAREAPDDWDANPQGRVFGRETARYTCWLRQPNDGDDPNEPIELFTARCGHPGYVAANLAVRWHPTENQIWYVEQERAGRHRLMSFDVASGATRCVDAPIADDLVFDFSPDGRVLVCAVGSRQRNDFFDGLWVKQLTGGKWWRVVGSQQLAAAPLGSLLESLRASRPVWRPTNTAASTTENATSEFVYASSVRDECGSKIQHTLSLVNLDEGASREMYRDTALLRDIHWHLSGEYLALVREKETARLHTLSLDGELSPPLTDAPIRRFAGWNASGELFAFTAADPAPAERCWSTLLQPAPDARDRLFVGKNFDEPPRVIFDGMRVTFPTWSADDARLTFWATFTPNYQLILPWGMPWGDPAAVLDTHTGRIDWMTVDAQELYEVGHWHLLKKNYERAWQYYEQAHAAAEAESKTDVPTPHTFTNLLLEAICLDKLDRHEEAHARFDEFRESFTAWAERDARGDQQQTRQARQARQAMSDLLIGLFIAQAYLSVDAGEDAATALRAEMQNARDEARRMPWAIALSQVLLIQREHEQYAALATDIAASAADRFNLPQPDDDTAAVTRQLDVMFTGMALLPMFHVEFLQTLPEEQRDALVVKWKSLRSQSSDSVVQLGCDLFLAAAHEADGRQDAADRVKRRIARNPASKAFLGDDGLAGISHSVWRE